MDCMDFDQYTDSHLCFSSTITFTPGKDSSKTPHYLKSTKSSTLKTKSKTNTPSLNATNTTNNAAPNTPYPLFSPMRKVVKAKRGFTPCTQPQVEEQEVNTMQITETPSSTKRKRGIFGSIINKLFDNTASPPSPSIVASPKINTSTLLPSTNTCISLSTATTPLTSKRMEKRRKQMEDDKENKLNCSVNPNDEEFLKLKEEVANIQNEIQSLKTKRSSARPVNRRDVPLTRSQTISKGLKELVQSARTPSSKSLK